MISYQQITIEQVLPLRQKILRPHQSVEECRYDCDHFEQVCHWGALDHNKVIAIATIFPERHTDIAANNPWRLRGMACDENYQGQGIGGIILERCLEHIRQQDGDLLWCNGRTPAFNFYKRFGFTTFGDEFTIEGIGPHYIMMKPLS
ncbi:GNAT family N-acetyltransferase [Pleionea sp. CnH1-48]|uniref:GNAT family N-acetyltransferase n=1 Tax=Pleionea sp. CnH1-48 TaxID=2954494 RepID=UPI002097E5E5|nr:GNAT family N-acetyltransferase [Pleionea sp. CnH1-48]MCO7226860.1 GNAT family N-acetyltransferase [Pleionea sp. CnH1-48]